ncbi:MAG: hypothetical protein ABIQ74_10745 [Chitinophagales bacterium]
MNYSSFFLPDLSIAPTSPIPVTFGIPVNLEVTAYGGNGFPEDYFFWQPPTYLDMINGGEVTATPLTDITYTVTAMTTTDNDLGCCSTLEVELEIVPIELGCACDVDATHCDGCQGLMPADLPAGATYYFKQLNTLHCGQSSILKSFPQGFT